MLAALPSCRAEISSTPDCTRACETLKLAVPSRPKQRRAPYPARSRARVAATVGVLCIGPLSRIACPVEFPRQAEVWPEAVRQLFRPCCLTFRHDPAGFNPNLAWGLAAQHTVRGHATRITCRWPYGNSPH